MAVSHLRFKAAEGQGRACGAAETPVAAPRGVADLAALRQLSKDAEQALWDFSVHDFDAVLKALETSIDQTHSEKNAVYLGALKVWCEVNPLPVNRKPADRTGIGAKRHELRTVLNESFGDKRAANEQKFGRRPAASVAPIPLQGYRRFPVPDMLKG